MRPRRQTCATRWNPTSSFLRGLLVAAADASIDNDPRLDALSELRVGELGPEKAIIFTSYADTGYPHETPPAHCWARRPPPPRVSGPG